MEQDRKIKSVVHEISLSLQELNNFGDAGGTVLLAHKINFLLFVDTTRISYATMEPCTKRRRTCMPFPPNIDSWKGAKSDRALYPTLLLHLGYSIGGTNQEKNELLVVLCSHWGVLADDVLDPEVEIELVTQILESNGKAAVIEPVLQVVSKLLSAKHAPSLVDELAIALTLHIDKFQLVTHLLGQCAAKSSQTKVIQDHHQQLSPTTGNHIQIHKK